MGPAVALPPKSHKFYIGPQNPDIPIELHYRPPARWRAWDFIRGISGMATNVFVELTLFSFFSDND